MALTGLEAAADTTKQILTLSTGMIALTVTFAEKFSKTPTGIVVHWTLVASWAAFMVTVFFGVITLMAITGSAGQTSGTHDGSNIKIPAIPMVIGFVAGMGFVVAAGYNRFG